MISRAQPVLGTIVSIRAEATEDAVRAAFATIATVHRLMSAQSDASDLARINRHAHRQVVSVHPWTFRVLRAAAALSRTTQGAFDVTLRRLGASFRDIQLLANNQVRLRRRARLELDGIAKGFAVDRAVGTLRALGARSGTVNAGGDLRVFGDFEPTIKVRLPGNPRFAVPVCNARGESVATSSGYFGSALQDARDGRALCSNYSITVRAPSCMLADGLTKAVAALGPQPALLQRYHASAYLLDAKGGLHAAPR
jgi:thiamine biosynthesis lipoprotein